MPSRHYSSKNTNDLDDMKSRMDEYNDRDINALRIEISRMKNTIFDRIDTLEVL